MSSESNNEQDYNIDLETIIFSIKNNKKFIIIFTIISLFFSSTFALLNKKTWMGEFQIVLSNDTPTSAASAASASPQLSRLILPGMANKLLTEVEILRSASVLMPVFKELKLKKEMAFKKKLDEWKFKSWRNNNLDISLIRRTNVLSLSLKDNDKDLIIPTLNQITNVYKDYSGKNTREQMEREYQFLFENQKKYENLSLKSLAKVQEYSTKYDLSSPLVDPNELSNLDKDTITNTIPLEQIRINSANQIRSLKELIKEVKNTQNSEFLAYITANISELSDNSPQNLIKETDKTLAESRSLYSENDPIIQKLLIQRKIYISLLREQILNTLEAKIIQERSIIESSFREKDILINFKKIIFEAQRDSAILTDLSKRLSRIEVAKARDPKPWELITEPTLLDKPVSMSRLKISALGLPIGLFLSSILALILDYKKNIINSANQIISLFPKIRFLKLKNSKKNKWSELIEIFLITLGNLEIKESIGIFPLGNINKNNLDFLVENFKNSSDKEFKILNQFKDILSFKKKIFIFEVGRINKNELDDFKEKISFLENEFSTIIIDN